MIFNVNDRVIAARYGSDYGDSEGFNYGIGWKGTVRSLSYLKEITVDFDNGVRIVNCDDNNFELIKEEAMNNLSCKDNPFKPGDTVKVKGCTDNKAKFNGKTGVIIDDDENYKYPHSICFDGTGTSCGKLFADSELEVIPQVSVGDKVMVFDGSYSMEFVNGEAKFSGNIVDSGTTKYIYEITAMSLVLPTDDNEEVNDTIIRRISDGRVFFVQQRFLKAYVAMPKFKQGQFVEHEGTYKRIIKVIVHESEASYDITAMPDRYNKSDCGFYCNIKESELSEVAQ